MGRRRTRDLDLPPLVFRRGERYYFGQKGIALGGPGEWLNAYARLRGEGAAGRTFADAAAAYIRTELARKAPKTQTEYSRQLTTLVRVFGTMPLGSIEPGDVRDFLDLRPRIAGTREKAVLSAVFNFARGRRLTAAANPCAGIRGVKAHRDRYVTDAELAAAVAKAKAAGDRPLADFLALCYYTGQRPSDALRICPADAQDGRLRIRQGKGGRIVRPRLVGPLLALFRRLERGCPEAAPLIRDAAGKPVRLQAIRRRFKALGFDWQIRDIRAKAASDLDSVSAAKDLLGHAAETTTDGYRRSRTGTNAEPVMRRIAKPRARK